MPKQKQTKILNQATPYDAIPNQLLSVLPVYPKYREHFLDNVTQAIINTVGGTHLSNIAALESPDEDLIKPYDRWQLGLWNIARKLTDTYPDLKILAAYSTELEKGEPTNSYYLGVLEMPPSIPFGDLLNTVIYASCLDTYPYVILYNAHNNGSFIINIRYSC